MKGARRKFLDAKILAGVGQIALGATGVVGGAGTASNPNNCTTFSAPPELAPMFGSFPQAMPALGGNAVSGYSGGWTGPTAATGPLTNSASLGSVILGNTGFSGSFDGAANSNAHVANRLNPAHSRVSGCAHQRARVRLFIRSCEALHSCGSRSRIQWLASHHAPAPGAADSRVIKGEAWRRSPGEGCY